MVRPRQTISDDDFELVERARGGEEAAFATLVGRHHSTLLRTARAFVRDPAAAEDVAQDTWLAVVRGLDRFEGRARFKTWLLHILANRARTRGVRDARMLPVDMSVDDYATSAIADRFDARGRWAQPPVAWQDAETALGDRQLVAHLERAIAELPANQRLVVTLRDVEGLESDEVCNLLGITETNQRVLLHRARTRLRAALAAQLGSTP